MAVAVKEATVEQKLKQAREKFEDVKELYSKGLDTNSCNRMRSRLIEIQEALSEAVNIQNKSGKGEFSELLDTLPNQVAILGSAISMVSNSKSGEESSEFGGILFENLNKFDDFLSRAAPGSGRLLARMEFQKTDRMGAIDEKFKELERLAAGEISAEAAKDIGRTVRGISDELKALMAEAKAAWNDNMLVLMADRRVVAGVREHLEFAEKAHDLGNLLQLVTSLADARSLGMKEQDFGFNPAEKMDYLLVVFKRILDYDEKAAQKEELDLRKEAGDFLGWRYKALRFEGEGFKLMADRVAMWRVFSNLVKNAVDAGASEIRIVFAEPFVSVIDNGQGMPPEVVKNLFTPFFTHGKKEGTGLGLTIVKEHLDKAGAKISVESQEGEGTTFTIEFPPAKKE